MTKNEKILTEEMVKKILSVCEEAENEAFFNTGLRYYVFAYYSPHTCELDVWYNWHIAGNISFPCYGVYLVYDVIYHTSDPTYFSDAFVRDVLAEASLPESIRDCILHGYADAFVSLCDLEHAFPREYKSVMDSLIGVLIGSAGLRWHDCVRRLDDILSEVYADGE